MVLAPKVNGRERQSERQSARIIPFPLQDTRPKCLWCDACFSPVKPNQRYCQRYHSRLACELRRERLIDALASEFAVYGLKRKHVELCAELSLKRCQDVARALGYAYDELAKVWRTS